MIFCGFYLNSHSQKQYFQHFSIEQGLVQSQVSAICQDMNDNLWIGTYGGISRFDGKKFVNYTETDGLSDNYITCLLADDQNNVWIGTQNGVSRFNNGGFINFFFEHGPGDNIIRNIVEDDQGTIWVLTALHLYPIREGRNVSQAVMLDSVARVTSIFRDASKKIWASVRRTGIYSLDNGQWRKRLSLENTNYRDIFIAHMIEDPNRNGILAVSPVTLLRITPAGLTPFDSLSLLPGHNFQSIFSADSTLWVNTASGLFCYKNRQWRVAESDADSSTIQTLCIFQDREKNTWFGTNGAGLLRLHARTYSNYDQFSSRHATAMAMTEGRDGRLYVGTTGFGVYSITKDSIRHFDIPSADKTDQQIANICRGVGNDLIIFTVNSRGFILHDGKMTRFYVNGINTCVNNLYMDSTGTICIAACDGFYRLENNTLKKYCSGFITNAYPLSENRLLLSFYKGLSILYPDGRVEWLMDELIKNARIVNVIVKNDYFIIVTMNKGLLIYQEKKKTATQYTTHLGLNSDIIYSAVEDKTGNIWLGTGHGLNRLIFDANTGKAEISNFARPGDISSDEFNQNTAVCDQDNTLWFGTASGLMKFILSNTSQSNHLPPLVLSEVKVFSKTVFAGSGSNKLSLSHQENRLAFYFNCASYENRDRILYQYRLEGLESVFSDPSFLQEIIYPSLPPGHYVFRARAFIRENKSVVKEVSFPFEIRPAFYQTLAFKILMYLILIAAVAGLLRYRLLKRDKRRREIEKIKFDEQVRLRQQAAEDFHDELGNTITRIQLLSDIVRSKLHNGSMEAIPYMDRIKENVNLLYQGTRDVIWALNPQSDKIDEIVFRLSSTGFEMFGDLNIQFMVNNKIERDCDITLHGHDGRNIVLIFKEAMSNILKHAKADKVTLVLEKTDRVFQVTLEDNGTGFDVDGVQKGYGSLTMKKRAEKIHAHFTIDSTPKCGTRYHLTVPVQVL
jgi:signal transduction histidine kinase/ligand-binding sensor domain-containing protein